MDKQSFYTSYSVFKQPLGFLNIADPQKAIDEIKSCVQSFPQVTFRGFYNAKSFKHDSDIIVWAHSNSVEDLQNAISSLLSTQIFAHLNISFQITSMHVEAEFNKSHIPAFTKGANPKKWLCIYPFIRSYDWYLLRAEKRSQMMKEHGLLGARYPNILANTTACFALSDYEWMLAFESDCINDLVNMIKDLRYTEARLFVQEETPFYTGKK